MADLKTFSGFPVQNLSSDSTSVGQLYYNTSSGQFKAILEGGAPIGTWASSGDVNTARYRMQGGAGTQTAGLIAGGSPTTSATEEYNGAAWATVNAMPAATTDFGLAGLQTAALGVAGEVGGSQVNTVLEYDGTNWTAGGVFPAAAQRVSVGGTQTAGITVGGAMPGYANSTFHYNGSSWTAGGNYPTVRANGATAGTQTAAIAYGGYTPPATTDSNIYNGSSWTEITSMNTARAEMGFSGSGTQTSTLAFAGSSSSPTRVDTESWNGTTWTEVANLAASRNSGGCFGSASAAVYAAGSPPTIASTEEWTAADIQVKTLTTS